ncbi:MAG: tRNA (N6-threonylcarbamoyladenosine(37)-N6)-methyltransferase TrmO [Syntrophotaleaceae bacterium]
MTKDSYITYRPIGILRSPYTRRIDAPHQSTGGGRHRNRAFAPATLELEDWLDEKVLQDLAGFERLWLIFAFHRSEGWKSSVKPPQVDRSGAFWPPAPHRPNSIGLSAVELAKIEGRTLHLRGVDLLDGTPVLDIKPYVPYADAFPDAKAGWIDDLDRKAGTSFRARTSQAQG